MGEGREVQLMGGPLDGMTFAAAPAGEHGDGAYMIVPGEISRAVYEPEPGEDPDVWIYRGLIG